MKTLSFLLLVIVFCSCSRTYYAPTNANIPLLREKGDVSLSGGFAEASGASAPAGGEVQLAFSPKNRLAFMVNFTSLGADGQSDQTYYYGYGWTLPNNQPASAGRGTGTYVEAAVGSYTTLGAGKWVAEGYAGIGRGWINAKYDSYGTGKAAYTRVFVQPNIGYRSKNFEWGFSPRVSYVNRDVRRNDFQKGTDMEQELRTISQEAGIVVLEPTMSLRFGTRNVKLCLNETVSIAGERECWSNSLFSIGLSFRFNDIANR